MQTGIQSERPRLREGLLLAGYVLIVIAAAVTVLIPELSKAPETESTPQTAGKAP